MPWMKRLVTLVLCLFLVPWPVRSQSPKPSPVTAVRCGRMIDVKAGRALANAVILIENGRITAAGPDMKVPAGARAIDLGAATVLPGLIDTHTHLLTNLDPQKGDEQLSGTMFTQMSPAKRALLGAGMAREMLEAGFTSVRDLGNSGVNGDVALRDAIHDGWVVGARMAVSTRALSPLGGQYGVLSEVGKRLLAPEYVEATRTVGAPRPRRHGSRTAAVGNYVNVTN